MKKIISIGSSSSLGVTFIDWSLHFLSGQTNYYNVKQGKRVSLVANPLNEQNAHGHCKNHPRGFLNTQMMIDKLKQQSSGLYSFYAGTIPIDVVAKDIDVNIQKLTLENYEYITKAQVENFQKEWTYCCNNTDAVIFISLPEDVALYTSFTRTDTTENEKIDNHDQLFFSDSKNYWDEQNNIWDVRERLALCVRPFDLQYKKFEQLDFNNKHFHVPATDLWHNGILTFKEMMAFCKLNILPERFSQWKDIYQQWISLQQPGIYFAYNYKNIVNAIVNNQDLSLPKLTFMQEIIIQHCLIYQHNLNLKTWQLSKFPDNTQDLYKLLEPNIHTISKIY